MEKTIVLTGATSGFGAAAVDRLLNRTNQPIVIGARSVEASREKYGDRVKVHKLDLERLSSVKQFCAEIENAEIATLGMNAGITSRKIQSTEDGFDRSFQVNFLSHFLMFELLRKQLTKDAIIITTGSGTHDPEEKAPPPPPRHADAKLLAYPQNDPGLDRFPPRAAARAYTSSKLCCILFAQEIANRYPHYRAASFDPGFLPETNLAREFPKVLAALIKRIVPLTMPRDRTGRIATTAPAYADLLLGDGMPEENGGYLAMRAGKAVEVCPSALARTSDIGTRLWSDTKSLLHLS